MKKLLSITLLSFGLLSMSSCTKDWNCTCSIVITDQGGAVVSSNSSTSVLNGTKGNTTEECEAGNAQTSGNGFTTTKTCVIAAR